MFILTGAFLAVVNGAERLSNIPGWTLYIHRPSRSSMPPVPRGPRHAPRRV